MSFPARAICPKSVYILRTVFPLGIIALALTGCATTRFTRIYCLSHDQALPSEPPKVHDKLTGKADEDIRIVAGSAVRLRAYAGGLRTILEGCREPSA